MRVTITRNQHAIDVSVPFKLKERAKKIKGYRWNAESRLWSYPNDRATLSALIAEFGDDADVIGCPKPTIGPETPAPTIRNVYTEEVSRLSADIENVRTGSMKSVPSETTFSWKFADSERKPHFASKSFKKCGATCKI